MDNALHPMRLEDVQAAPSGAMLYLEYRLELKYHQSGFRRAGTICAMLHPDHMAANYGHRYRCWKRRPSLEDMKAHEWRENPC